MRLITELCAHALVFHALGTACGLLLNFLRHVIMQAVIAGDVQQDSHSSKEDHHRGTTRADERKCLSRRGQKPRANADVHEYLQTENDCDAAGQHAAESVAAKKGDANAAVNDEEEPPEYEQRADQAEFFRNDREDEVRLTVRHVQQFLMAVVEANAEESAGTQRIIGLNQLITVAKRVFPGINERGQSRHTVGLNDGEQRKERREHDREQKHLLGVATTDKEQCVAHQTHDNRHGHVRLQHNKAADNTDDQEHR